MRVLHDEDVEVGVPISPLIDCVFLLLIFFLVTTMMKKWEMQIPIDLPVISSQLAYEGQPDAVVIAIGTDGALHEVVSRNQYTGEVLYQPISDLLVYLSVLRSRQGLDTPLEIAATRDVPVQEVVDVFDICQLQGFSQTRVRLGGEPGEYND